MQEEQKEILKGRHKVSELKKAGIIFIMIAGYNRNVNHRHIKDIVQNVRKVGCFLTPIRYITAMEYFEFYPDREIALESGKIITKDTEEIGRILFILDGQHRYEANEEMEIEDENYQSTLLAEHVELPEGISPDVWMTTLNSTNSNWNEIDRGRFIAKINPDKENNVTAARLMREQYKLSERAAYALLNFNDNYRKSHYVSYMNNPAEGLCSVLQGTKENRERGWKTLHAIEVGFRHYPKVIRNMAVIDFVLSVYTDSPDNKKEETVAKIHTFLTSLPDDEAKYISLETVKAYRKANLVRAWAKFVKETKKEAKFMEYQELALNAEREWAKMNENKN